MTTFVMVVVLMKLSPGVGPAPQLVKSPRAGAHGSAGNRNLTLVSAKGWVLKIRLKQLATYLAARGHRVLECALDDSACLALGDVRLMTMGGPTYFNKHSCVCAPKAFCHDQGNSAFAKRWLPSSRATARRAL